MNSFVFSVRQFVLVLSLFLCLHSVSIPAFAKSRVALVTLSEQESMRVSIDLATVEISKRTDFDVVERQEIQQVLREQNLTLQTKTSGEQAIALGRLLSVDAFAVCSPSPDGAYTRLVVYETTTSARLIDIRVETESPEKVASKFSENIIKAIRKLELLQATGLRFVSFHGLRNVDLPIAWTPWIEQTYEQLQQHFSAVDKLAVLERTRLHFVNKERLLPTAKVQAQLLASSTNVLVQFSKADVPSAIKITLIVSIPGSEQTQNLVAFLQRDASQKQLAELVKRADHKIASSDFRLNTAILTKSGKQQRERESSRLHREASRLFTRGEWQEAAIFSEATYALQPENHRHLAYLIFTLDYYAESIFKTSAVRIEQPNNDFQAIQADWLQAIRLLEYRLDLIELLHARRKHESSWHRVMWKSSGDFPPWHRSISDFKHFDAERMPLVVEPFRAHCQRFYRVWFKQILRYVQEHVKDADEASHAIHKILHQGYFYLKYISDSPEQWHARCFEQYDSWREILRANGWDRADPTHVKAILALNRLLDFHKYDLYHFSDKQLTELKQRFESLSQHPSEEVSFPASIQVARLDIRFHKSTTNSIKERNIEIEKHIERLAKPILARLALKLPAPSLDDIDPGHPFTTIKDDFDSRILRWTFCLKAVATLHSDFTQRRKTFGMFYEQCMELDIFPPAIFHNSLPPHIYDRHNHSAISKDNLPERVALYEKALRQLRTGKGLRSVIHPGELILTLQIELDKEKSLLNQFQEVASADCPWKNLTLLAGEVGLPEKHRDSTRIKVLGFTQRDGHVYYLTQRPTSERNNFEVIAYQISRTDPKKPIRLNQAVVQGGPASLSKEQFGYYSKICTDSTPNQLAVDNRFLYWNRVGSGILILPLDGSESFCIDEVVGLPSNFVHTIVAASEKLYAWVGRPGKESILVAIFPATRKIELLASSERVLSKNELDNRRNPRITRLAYFDAPKNRLLFWINNSIWAWDLEYQKTSEILRIPWKKDHWLRSIVALPHSSSLLIDRSLDYWLVDLSHDTRKEIPVATKLSSSFGQPAMLLQNQVWLRSPWGRYDISSQTYREMRLPLSDLQVPPMWWHPWCEVLEGEKQCIIWDRYHLWLAELKNSNESNSREEE